MVSRSEDAVTMKAATASLLLELSSLADSFQDVRLLCPGGQHSVQALLLAAASPFLDAILSTTDTNDRDAVIIFPDFSLEEIRQLVSCLFEPPALTSCCSLVQMLIPCLDSKTHTNGAQNTRSQNCLKMDASGEADSLSDSHEDRRIVDDAEDNDPGNEADTVDDIPPDEDSSPHQNADDQAASSPTDSGPHGSPRLVSQTEASELVIRYTVPPSLPGRLFECDRCRNFATANMSTLRTHILSELNLFLFKCSVCNKLFRQRGYLNRHVRAHGQKKEDLEESEDLDSCRAVEKAVDIQQRQQPPGQLLQPPGQLLQPPGQLLQAEIYANQTEVTAEDITKVAASELDGKLVNLEQALLLVKDIVHKEGAGYRCNKCGKLFPRIVGNCREHVWRTHFNVYLFKCNKIPGCQRKFRKITDFKDHIRSHEVKMKQRDSLIEARGTDIPPSADFHLLTHPLDVDKAKGFEIAGLYFYNDPVLSTYRCKLCAFSHTRIQGTRNHVLANHLSQVFLYRCQDCGKRFRYENQYKLHTAVHKEGKFVCSQCGKQLITKRYLAQHEMTAHMVGLEVSCPEGGCTYRGKTQAQLERHRRVHHTADRSDWQYCEHCGKAFLSISDLKLHLGRCLQGRSQAFKQQRVGSCYEQVPGCTSFRCLLCQAVLRSQRSVVEHIKKMHSDQLS